jgi:hypothetical protein
VQVFFFLDILVYSFSQPRTAHACSLVFFETLSMLAGLVSLAQRMLAGLVSLAGLVRARACLRSAADAIPKP